jgi:pectinesterase
MAAAAAASSWWGTSCCLCLAVLVIAEGGDAFIAWDDLSIPSSAAVTVGLGKAAGGAAPTTIVVAQDGTGHSRTVQGAVDMVPDANTRRVKILVRPGVYRCVV